LEAAPRIERSLGDAEVVLFDDLTLYVANLLVGPDHEMLDESQVDFANLERRLDAEVDALLEVYERGDASWLIVSNEVGMGLVPEYAFDAGIATCWVSPTRRRPARRPRVLLLAGVPLELRSISEPSVYLRRPLPPWNRTRVVAKGSDPRAPVESWRRHTPCVHWHITSPNDLRATVPSPCRPLRPSLDRRPARPAQSAQGRCLDARPFAWRGVSPDRGGSRSAAGRRHGLSTADVAGAIFATAQALGEKSDAPLAPVWRAVEPTDGSRFPAIVGSNHREGRSLNARPGARAGRAGAGLREARHGGLQSSVGSVAAAR